MLNYLNYMIKILKDIKKEQPLIIDLLLTCDSHEDKKYTNLFENKTNNDFGELIIMEEKCENIFQRYTNSNFFVTFDGFNGRHFFIILSKDEKYPDSKKENDIAFISKENILKNSIIFSKDNFSKIFFLEELLKFDKITEEELFYLKLKGGYIEN